MTQTPLDRQAASPEIIAVASQKGGVGKSTTALSLSIALVAAGRNVLLIDLDPQGNVGHALMSGEQRTGTEQMLREAILTRDMITATEIPDLYLAPSGPGLSGIEGELAQYGDARTRLHQALGTLSALPFRFDHVVIDCPPSVGLLSLNALVAAHRILLPLPCESVFLEGLPTLLQTIDRLRAGLKQPLHAVHLLIVQRAASRASAQALVRTLRQDYGRIVLRSEIPYSDAVKEAAERGRPLLAHCPHCDVSQAYLEMAAEWLLEYEEHRQPEHRWSFRGRQERIAAYRDAMRKRIQAWLLDPTSLLYDETWEDQHQQDALVLDELFHIKSLPRHRRLMAPLALLLILGLGLLVQLRFPDLQWWRTDGDVLRQEFGPRTAESALSRPDRIGDMGEAAGPGDAAELSNESDPTENPLESELETERAEPDPRPPRPGQGTGPDEVVEPDALEPAEDALDLAREAEPDEPLSDADPAVPGLLSRDREPEEAVAIEVEDVPSAPLSSDRQSVIEEIRLTPEAYRWQVQVLAGRSLDRVKEDSRRFMQEFSSMLEGRTLTISQSRLGDARDAFYRLRVLDWETRSEAAAWCNRLRSQGQQCFVIGVTLDDG
ncbi:AAA family ATPase [Imhoffiella purpurea]|uniref:Chromosome (Plasmid) partitioning protein ParA / Sporulation initiation inhibitor protein Soj n=1 Tax=Imhoffiella purpurea TaxID=1249627 RepID=W9UZZ1_9GAMM|nr:AAA family ATPase [Imhoffiella purpurea]EXJ12654.1 Chromosome (plasmid) partitioning protein ParA / Sporulation initiation inhibitor protein Soj [Imhoffiella purpurea]